MHGGGGILRSACLDTGGRREQRAGHKPFISSCGPLHGPISANCRLQESPKLSQANGTPGVVLDPQKHDGIPDPVLSKGAGEGGWQKGSGTPSRSLEAGWGEDYMWFQCKGPSVWAGPDHFFPADTIEPPEASLSPMSVDSATSADTTLDTLDTTGDVTVEDVKDFLG